MNRTITVAYIQGRKTAAEAILNPAAAMYYRGLSKCPYKHGADGTKRQEWFEGYWDKCEQHAEVTEEWEDFNAVF